MEKTWKIMNWPDFCKKIKAYANEKMIPKTTPEADPIAPNS
jgi:hypothetical protein